MKKIMILILAGLPFGIFAQQSPEGYNLENNKINKIYTESETSFSSENEVVFSLPNESSIYNLNESNNKSLLDPYKGAIGEDDSKPIKEKLLKDANSYFGEGMVSFSKDGKTVFFSANRKIKNRKKKNEQEIKIKKAVMLRLFKASVNDNGEWINIEMLPFNSNKYSTGQPALNHDDTKLYFVSDGPESLGRTDIFVVDLHKDGTYGTPVNLGPKINSREREIFPFIDKNNLLFYSSDVGNNSGELDVFGCKIFDNTISTPVKLIGSVNIEKDKLAYNIDNKENFSSEREAVKEVDDIYTLIDSSPINIDCQQEILGIVKNVDTQELLPNVKIMLFDRNDKEILSSISNEMDASFIFMQSCKSTYKLKGYLEGYLIGELDIKTVNDLNAESIEIVMNMTKAPEIEINLIVNETELKNTEDLQVELSKVEASKDALSNKDVILNSYYNFRSNIQVYTVQIGAFIGNAQTDKYFNLSSLFNHHYDDGFNRYYSGVFESRLEAINHLKKLKNKGYTDAFIVGLQGGKRY